MKYDWTFRKGHLLKLGALTLLYRTNSPTTFGIAGWHHPNSLTWRWLFHVSYHAEGRLFRRVFWKHGRQCGANFWKLEFYIHWQRPMWMQGSPQRERAERRTAA